MTAGLSMSKVFERVDYAPHAVQRKVHGALGGKRFRVVCAGRRTGKSTLGGHELTARAYEAYFERDKLSKHGKRHEYWIVGPEYTDSEKEFRVLWNDITQLGMPLDKPGSYNDPNGGNMHLSLWDGKFQVHAKSAKYPDSLVGEGLKGVILAEAAKLKPSIWFKFIRPMLADERGWALMTSTPEGKNWFYEQWMKGLTNDPEWWGIRMPSWTNDILFPLGREDPEIASMSSDMDEETFKQEIGAEFTEFTGRVFKNFDEEMHCRPLPYNPKLPCYAAVDYGWTNPFVWLLVQVDFWENIYVIGEYYERNKRVDEIPDELIARGLVPAGMRNIYVDPASPGDTRILEDKLRVKSIGGTGGELTERLRLIRTALEIPKHLQHLPWGHPERLPKLFVDPVKCPNFVREFNDYRYPETKTERNDVEAPMKKDDHTPEAFGRFMAGYFGPRQRTGRSRVSQGVVG